jgi:hypothetical protein
MASVFSAEELNKEKVLNFIRGLTPPELFPSVQQALSKLWHSPPVEALELTLRKRITLQG